MFDMTLVNPTRIKRLIQKDAKKPVQNAQALIF